VFSVDEVEREKEREREREMAGNQNKMCSKKNHELETSDETICRCSKEIGQRVTADRPKWAEFLPSLDLN
jgi:hypothetical protein